MIVFLSIIGLLMMAFGALVFIVTMDTGTILQEIGAALVFGFGLLSIAFGAVLVELRETNRHLAGLADRTAKALLEKLEDRTEQRRQQ